ncbi:MAG: trigger factor family protein [Amoebophilaceae bacterium]|nr:trigger factor family protein [Amoebophilaceae bacterium]
MDIQFNKLKPSHGIISITIHAPDYQEAIEKKVQHYAQHTRLKGFRLGTVPTDLIRKIHGVSIVAEELNKLTTNALQTYLKQESISIFMDPLLVDAPSEKDFKEYKDKPFNFSYEIGLMEDTPIDLGPHIAVHEFKIEHVDDALIDEFVSGIQLVHGASLSMDTSTEDAVLHGSIEDAASGEVIELRIIIARIPEDLRKAFLGRQVGDEIMLTKEMLTGHTASLLGLISSVFAYISYQGTFPYSFKINKIACITPAPLNTQLFDLVLGPGVASSAVAFKEALAKIILFDKRNEANSLFADSLRDTFLNHFPVDLPDDFIKKSILAKNTKATLEEIASYYEDYQKNLRWEILLGRIMRSNDLVITPDEVIEEAKQHYINYIKENLGQEEIDKYSETDITQVALSFLKEDEGKHYITLHEKLSKHKVLSFIKKNITITVETVTISAFDQKRFAIV